MKTETPRLRFLHTREVWAVVAIGGFKDNAFARFPEYFQSSSVVPCAHSGGLMRINAISCRNPNDLIFKGQIMETMMRNWLVGIAALVLLSTATTPPAHADDNGLITLKSKHSFEDTVDRFEAAVNNAGEVGFRLYTRIDHAAAAREAGTDMPESLVIVFGTPAHAARGFQAAPTLAIDGPLKALVWENQAGEVMLSYNSTDYIGAVRFPRHGLPDVSGSPDFAVLGENLAKFADYATN